MNDWRVVCSRIIKTYSRDVEAAILRQSPLVMRSDLRFAEMEESGRVVVKDVALLLFAEEFGGLDGLDLVINDTVRPHHLIRAEHQPLSEPRIHQPSEVFV